MESERENVGLPVPRPRFDALGGVVNGPAITGLSRGRVIA
jgi:hypothetical protein